MDESQKTNPLARGNKDIKPLEVYAEHAEIRKQVHGEIKKLHKTMRSIFPSVNVAIDKFLNCLTPLKNLHDPGRLPVYATRPRSKHPNKQCCVWAVVSCLVQAYWEYELNDEYANKGLVQMYLKGLRKINEHYPELKIVGAENKGWWLDL